MGKTSGILTSLCYLDVRCDVPNVLLEYVPNVLLENVPNVLLENIPNVLLEYVPNILLENIPNVLLENIPNVLLENLLNYSNNSDNLIFCKYNFIFYIISNVHFSLRKI